MHRTCYSGVMARPLRIEYPDASYYISVEAREDVELFTDSDNKDHFLFLLNKICLQFHWHCFGYAVLKNSFLLMIQTPDANLGRGMRELNGIFTQHFNRKNNRTGPVLQGRYKAIVVDGEDKKLLKQLTRKLFQQLQKNELSRDPGQWKWSHAPALLGRTWSPKWLQWRYILHWYGKETGEGRREFLADIFSLEDNNFLKVQKQQFIGSKDFINRAMQQQANYLYEVTLKQRDQKYDHQLLQSTWIELNKQNLTRNEAIKRIYDSGQYSLEKIGELVGLHYSTISRIINSE